MSIDLLKTIIGITAVLLIFVGYVPYFRDLLRGITHPHAYSWFLWSVLSVATFGLQLTDGAGIGAYVTLAAGINAAVIFVLAVRIGERDITRSDTIFLLMGGVGIALWLLADQPLLSVLLLCVVELLAFVPTVRKTWNKPYSETMSSYVMNTVRFSLAVAALNHYSFLTALYPAMWATGNGLFVVLLITRRKRVPAPNAPHPAAVAS